MNIATLVVKLGELKSRQTQIDTTWKKTGNREFLAFMTELLPMALEAERCSIFIHNPDDDNVWIQCGTNLREKQITVPTGNSIVGKVIATGKMIIDNHLEKRIGIHDVVALKTGFTAHSALCVPVLDPSSHTVTGAIQLLNKQPSNTFSDDDVALVEKLAKHMHINIENIFLGQEMANITLDIGKKIELIEERLMEQGVPL